MSEGTDMTSKLPTGLARRQILRGGAALAVAGVASPFIGQRTALAAWPDRPVRLLVPFGAGGPVDVVARLLQPALGDELKASVFVENKPGAGGNIGVGQAARAEPDGYTVLVTSNTLVVNPLLYASVPYDPIKDFSPLVDIAGSPTAFAVHSELGVNTIAEFVALSKQKRGGLNYGSAGFSTTAHLAAEFFRSRAGIEMTHVPFNGAGPAVQALIGRQVDMVSGALAGAHPHIVAGTLKGLAVTGEKRWWDLPNVPTMVESGYKDFVIETKVMMLVPAKTPDEIEERLASATIAILKTTDMRDKLRKAGLEPSALGPSVLKARFEREMPFWAEIVKAAGITPQERK
jgi:tripartite-type tricarboxylate transporter receptor subunit TctC